MKRFAKSVLSALLALAMCVSILSGLPLAASAVTIDYQTGSAEGFRDVIINWGQRETTATYLSQNAEAFYADNNTSYAELSQLPGSSSTGTVPGSTLYKELQSLMKSNHAVETSYNETRELYRYTDCQNSDPSSISSFYSGIAIGPDWDSGATWNREHTWPNSKGLGGNDENDIMMLRPTSGSENSSRGNKAYGESTGYYNPNSASSGTYDLRGDVARIMLYVYVRWGNTAYMWGSAGVIESKEVLLNWIKEDPVDTWEIGRNDSVESITGTRNVFVDYPELAFLLFNEEVPADMTTPSGEAASNMGYTITATVNNDAYGSVTTNGSYVTAFPAEGYQVSGFAVVAGDAEVTQNGNIFTVSASSDCTICVNFEAKASSAVNFEENGTVISTQTVHVGDEITLPAHSGSTPEGYSFAGWVTSPVSETTSKPDTIYTEGDSYTTSSSVTFYALYSRVDSESTGSSTVFELFSGSLEEGDYVIAYDGGALRAAPGTNGRLAYSDVTITNNTITSPADDIVWHIAPTSDNYYTIYNEYAAVYAAGTGAKSKATLLRSVTDYAKWTISGSDAYNFVNLGNYNRGVNYTLRRNTTYGYACYHTSTGGDLSLYKLVSGTMYYSTSCGGKVPDPILYGDANGDGKINTIDLAMLRRYLANIDPDSGLSSIVVQAGADANGDSKISTIDLAMLRRYLANIDPDTGSSSVVLGPRS